MTSTDFNKLTEEQFKKFSKLIYDIAGIYLKDSKLTLLSNRLRKRLHATACENFDAYYDYIKKSKDQIEINEMLNAVSTNETYFFRNLKHFEALFDKIIPDMLAERRNPVKILSAGCSSGEEPFTLALLSNEKGYLDRNLVEITGIDLNTEVLQEAKRGVFSIKKLRNTDDKYIQKYFKKYDKDNYQLSKKITESVKFERVNLIKDEIKGTYDIIMCRNVMIYFDRDNQTELVNKFYNALKSDSYFIIGHSESLYFINSKFNYRKVIDSPIYYKE